MMEADWIILTVRNAMGHSGGEQVYTIHTVKSILKSSYYIKIEYSLYTHRKQKYTVLCTVR